MSTQKLPSNEHTFKLDTEGSDSRQRWTGNFTYKRPGLRIKSEIAKTTARLNGELKYLDEDMAFLHGIIAMLTHTVVDCPQWFKDYNFGYHDDFTDTNVILDIYKEIQKFEKEYFEKVWGDQESIKISRKKSQDESEE